MHSAPMHCPASHVAPVMPHDDASMQEGMQPPRQHWWPSRHSLRVVHASVQSGGVMPRSQTAPAAHAAPSQSEVQ
jgi:hypothetical protein